MINETDLEMWKPMIHHNPKYEISDRGKCRRIGKPNPLACSLTNSGYLQVQIYNKTKKKRDFFYIHRLVAIYFCEKTDESYNQIDHKDGNKLNNDATNLRFCTRSMNQRNRRIGKRNKTTGVLGVCIVAHYYRAYYVDRQGKRILRDFSMFDTTPEDAFHKAVMFRMKGVIEHYDLPQFSA